jgi:hypothetical protein
MIRALLLLFVASVVAGHQELSALYKSYKAAGGKVTGTAPTFNVKMPKSSDVQARDKSLFFPPLPGQTGVDYHPQLRSMVPNDTVTYYSWHVHVYFFHEDENVTARTLALRDNFIKTFSLATCDDSCFMGGPFDTCNQGKYGVTVSDKISSSLDSDFFLPRYVRVGSYLRRRRPPPLRPVGRVHAQRVRSGDPLLDER